VPNPFNSNQWSSKCRKNVNKVTLIGHLGADPEIKSLPGGGKVATFSVATRDSWKDKEMGERKELTHWHRAVVFNEPLIDAVIEKYL
jgi:single-strand DNA-binding protein